MRANRVEPRGFISLTVICGVLGVLLVVHGTRLLQPDYRPKCGKGVMPSWGFVCRSGDKDWSFAEELAFARQEAYISLVVAGVLLSLAVLFAIKAVRRYAAAAGPRRKPTRTRRHQGHRDELASRLEELRAERDELRPQYESLKRRGYRREHKLPEPWATTAERWAEVNAEIDRLRSVLRGGES